MRYPNLMLILLSFVSLGWTANALSAEMFHYPDHLFQRQAGVKVWIFLTDKPENSSEKNVPRLTARAIERRQKHDRTALTFYDRALDPVYLNHLGQLGISPIIQSRWLNAVSANITLDQWRNIEDLPFVKQIRRVATFKKDKLTGQPRSFFHDQKDLDYGPSFNQANMLQVIAAHDAGYHGEGILIGVLDTGFSLQHEAMQPIIDSGRLIATYDFINNDSNVENEPDEADNEDNHGTAVWSVIGGFSPGNLIGPAYGASFMLAKTEEVNSETPIEEDYWVAGLEWAEANGANIVSSSLGYLEWYEFEDLDGQTAPVTLAAKIAAQFGVLVCTAMGNEYGGHLIAPADADSIIAVGAVDSLGEWAGFSSIGPTYDGRTKPELVAQGSRTVCANPDDPTGYRLSNGTSLATPLISSVSALVMQAHPEWTVMQVREALMQTASQAHAPNDTMGWGIARVMEAMAYDPTSIENVLLDLRVRQKESAIKLTWNVRPNSRIVGYNVFRCETDICVYDPLNTSLIPADVFEFCDEAVLPYMEYRYRLTILFSDGSEIQSESQDIHFIPGHDDLVLQQNRPNPFFDTTRIQFSLPLPTAVSLKVYDVTGRVVKSLIDRQNLPAGEHTRDWNGLDQGNRPLASGIYFYELKTDLASRTKTLTFIR